MAVTLRHKDLEGLTYTCEESTADVLAESGWERVENETPHALGESGTH